MLDKAKLRGFLSDAFKKVNVADGREIVLILGPTGAGKSTSINYFLENALEEVYPDGSFHPVIDLQESKVPHSAKIGHSSSVSETLYAQVFDVKDKSFALCDCPGFGDTRGIEAEITAAINNQLAIKSSTKVRAMVVTIDMRALASGAERGVYLRNLLPAIESMLVDPKNNTKSLYFMFTKVDNPRHMKTLIRYLEKIKQELMGSFESEVSDAAKSYYANQIEAVNLMLECQENFLHVDPLDEGQSRAFILNQLAKSTPISINDFKFPEKDTTRIELSKILHDIANVGQKALMNVMTLPEKIKQHQAAIKAKESEIAAINQKVIALEKTGAEGDVKINDLTSEFDKIIANKNGSIVDVHKKIVASKKQIDKKQAELNRLDQSSLITYWEKEWDEKNKYGELTVGTQNTEVFHYNGVQYQHHDINHDKYGHEKFEISKPGDGEFKYSYTSSTGVYGYASVKIDIQKRHKPENAARIAVLRDEISAEREKIKGFELDIKTREKEIAETEKAKLEAIAQFTAGQLKLQEQMLKNLHHELSDAKNELKALQAECKTMLNDLNQSIKRVKDDLLDYEMVEKILKHLPVEDDTGLLAQFCQSFKDYLKDKAVYQAAADNVTESNFGHAGNFFKPAATEIAQSTLTTDKKAADAKSSSEPSSDSASEPKKK